MSGAPARGTVPRRQKRHRHHHHHHQHHHHHHRHPKHQKRAREETPEEPEEKRPKVNPIFLWASQREQRIVEVRCEDYDKRNRIKLTKTAQGWRSIPRTATNIYSTAFGLACPEKKPLHGGVGKPPTPASAVVASTIDEKENGEDEGRRAGQVAVDSTQQSSKPERVNGRTGDPPSDERSNKRARYDELSRKYQKIRDCNGLPLEDLRNGARTVSNWESRSRDGSRERMARLQDVDGDDQVDEDVAKREREDKRDEDCNGYGQDHGSVRRDKGKGEFNEVKNREGRRCRSSIEILQKDRLYQPRVVLEQLSLSQLPESHQSLVRQADGKNADNEREEEEQDEDEGIGDEEELEAADTPNDVEIEKSFEVVSKETHYKETKTIYKRAKASHSSILSVGTDATKTQRKADFDYASQNHIREHERVLVDKLEFHDEKIHETFGISATETKANAKGGVSAVLAKETAEVANGFGSCPTAKSARGKWQNSTRTGDELPENEEEAPDEPGEPLKLDYGDSSKILNALRNTPGLSVSITRTRTPDASKSFVPPSSRPSSKASSSSRSPDSQTECIERLLKTSVGESPSGAGHYADDQERRSPRANLPGLSIVIPSYRYRSSGKSAPVVAARPASPVLKHRVESPESTVNFPRGEAYPRDSKLETFAEEAVRGVEEEEEEVEDEDDCDSQVLEDLRRQDADSMARGIAREDGARGTHSNVNQEEVKASTEVSRRGQDAPAPLWINCNRNSEAQAKCMYQDIEHFDEQVLEELRTRGTVASPQPSGIPCSPASRRPSSAFLERLLPSPPCSVTCSEDAKNDLTLKGILTSPSCLDVRDVDKPRETSTVRNEQVPNHCPRVYEQAKEFQERINGARRAARTFLERSHSQETRTGARPMSSADIHSTYLLADRSAVPKRPMSAEYATARQKPSERYQTPEKAAIYTRGQPRSKALYALNEQEVCATSSSTDKLLDPANQLRELIETYGHLIPDPLLVPRSYLPALAAAPATEIPKLLASRPELRLPEALTRPDLLRDPDLLVISLAHLQHVLDHGEGPVARSHQVQPKVNNVPVKGTIVGQTNAVSRNGHHARPKLSCKPIGTLMPGPIDLSSNRKANSYPPLLRVRTGLLKQESEVSSTASSPDDSHLWHPLFGSQKRQQSQLAPPPPPPHQHQHQHQQQQHSQQQQHQQHASWHRTTLAS